MHTQRPSSISSRWKGLPWKMEAIGVTSMRKISLCFLPHSISSIKRAPAESWLRVIGGSVPRPHNVTTRRNPFTIRILRIFLVVIIFQHSDVFLVLRISPPACAAVYGADLRIYSTEWVPDPRVCLQILSTRYCLRNK